MEALTRLCTSSMTSRFSSSDSLSQIYSVQPIGGLRFVRSGNVVQVNIDIKRSYDSGSNTVLSGIPAGYRPAYAAYRDVGCGYGHPLRFHVVGDSMSAYNYNAGQNNNVSGGFSYITVDPTPDQ